MPDYQKMYLRLFNGLTDAVEALEKANYGTATEIMKAAQKAAEEIYLADSEAKIAENESISKTG